MNNLPPIVSSPRAPSSPTLSFDHRSEEDSLFTNKDQQAPKQQAAISTPHLLPSNITNRPRIPPAPAQSSTLNTKLQSSAFRPTEHDAVILHHLRKVTVFGHDPFLSSSTSSSPLATNKTKVKPLMNVLPIPLSAKPQNPPSIARLEYLIKHKKNEANAKGNYYLSQLHKLHHNSNSTDDITASLTILSAARRQFDLAVNTQMIATVNAMHVKITADSYMTLAQTARSNRDYTLCVDHVKQALFHYKVLSGITDINRNTSLNESIRLESDKRLYIELKNPKAYVRKLAIEDGEKLRGEAIVKLDEKQYDHARVKLNDAEVCFKYAKLSYVDTGMVELFRHVDLNESATLGDGMLEEIAANLKPVVAKDYAKLTVQLDQALKAYEKAKDGDGVKVVNNMRSCLANLQEGDVAWYNLAEALGKNDYDSAVSCLVSVRKRLYQSSKGLPFINNDLDKLVGVVLNENLPTLTMIAELAMEDGHRFKEAALEALKEREFEKASEIAKFARSCYAWVVENRSVLVKNGRESLSIFDDGDAGEIDSEEVASSSTINPNLNLSMDLMHRITTTFHSTDQSLKAFESNMRNIQQSIEVVEGINDKVSNANALVKGDEIMQTFYKQEEMNEVEEAFKSLLAAQQIYSDANFIDEVKNVELERSNLEGEVLFEKALAAVNGKNFVEAQKALLIVTSHFEKNGNTVRYENASKTLLCIQGDLVLAKFDKAMASGEYDSAVELGNECTKIYAESGDSRRKELIVDVELTVKSRAIYDAENFKFEAVQSTEKGKLAEARALDVRAQECLTWAGESTESINDILAVVSMAEKRLKGDECLAKAMSRTGKDSDSDSKEAKLWYSLAQDDYQTLMTRAADLLTDTTENGQHGQHDGTFALDLQDNVTKLYNVCREGEKMSGIENAEICSRADAMLDDIGPLLQAELYPEARLKLERTREIYLEISSDSSERVLKADAMLVLVESGASFLAAINGKKFEDAKVHFERMQNLLSSIGDMEAKSILALNPLVFGGKSAADMVIQRALSSGAESIERARVLLLTNLFDEAKLHCNEAMECYNWVGVYDKEIIDERVIELNEFIDEIERGKAFGDGGAIFDSAIKDLANLDYEAAIEKFQTGIVFFMNAKDEKKVSELKKLAARAEGCLGEVKSRELWKNGSMEEAFEKCEESLRFFETANDPQLMENLTLFCRRIEGDIMMLSFPVALKERDWDRAVMVMTGAFKLYAETKDPRKLIEIESVAPLAKVRDTALKDGESKKIKAGSILHKTKNADEAQVVLDMSKESFLWCDVSLEKAGVARVQKDIDEMRNANSADSKIELSYNLLVSEDGERGDGERALELLTESYSLFRSAGPSCFKATADTLFIVESVKAEVKFDTIEDKVGGGKVDVKEVVGICNEVSSVWEAVTEFNYRQSSKIIQQLCQYYNKNEKQLNVIIDCIKAEADLEIIEGKLSGGEDDVKLVCKLCNDVSKVWRSATAGVADIGLLSKSMRLLCELYGCKKDKQLNSVVSILTDLQKSALLIKEEAAVDDIRETVTAMRVELDTLEGGGWKLSFSLDLIRSVVGSAENYLKAKDEMKAKDEVRVREELKALEEAEVEDEEVVEAEAEAEEEVDVDGDCDVVVEGGDVEFIDGANENDVDKRDDDEEEAEDKAEEVEGEEAKDDETSVTDEFEKGLIDEGSAGVVEASKEELEGVAAVDGESDGVDEREGAEIMVSEDKEVEGAGEQQKETVILSTSEEEKYAADDFEQSRESEKGVEQERRSLEGAIENEVKARESEKVDATRELEETKKKAVIPSTSEKEKYAADDFAQEKGERKVGEEEKDYGDGEFEGSSPTSQKEANVDGSKKKDDGYEDEVFDC